MINLRMIAGLFDGVNYSTATPRDRTVMDYLTQQGMGDLYAGLSASRVTFRTRYFGEAKPGERKLFEDSAS